jgi:hypothetical protein
MPNRIDEEKRIEVLVLGAVHHLIQRLLDMHDVLGRHLDQAAPMLPETTYGADHPRRTEAGS